MRGRLTIKTSKQSADGGSGKEPGTPGLKGGGAKSTFLMLGASRGIGLACVKEAQQAGATRIVVVARDEKAAKAATSKISAVELLAANVALPQDVARIVSAVRDDANLKCVFCHAGIGYASEALPQRINDDQDDLVLATNFLGHAVIALSLLPRLAETSGKLIFSVGQQRFLARGPPAPVDLRQTPAGSRYAASKAAVYCLAHDIARRFPTVSVFLYDPGSVKTEFHPSALPAAAFQTTLEDAGEAWARIVAKAGPPPGRCVLWRSGKEAPCDLRNGALVFGKDVVEPDAMAALYDAVMGLVVAEDEASLVDGHTNSDRSMNKALRQSNTRSSGGSGRGCIIV